MTAFYIFNRLSSGKRAGIPALFVLIPAQDNFPGLARTHGVKPFWKSSIEKRWVMIGERSSQTESAPPSCTRFQTSHDRKTFNEQAFKDHFGPVDRHIRRGIPSIAIRPPWFMVSSMVRTLAAHRTFPDRHQSLRSCPVCHHIIEVLFSDVNRTGDTHLRANSRRYSLTSVITTLRAPSVSPPPPP